MANLLETVAKELIEAIRNDTIVLPTLPEVSLRVRDVAEDPDTSVADLAKIIAQDAALSGRVIKVANSAMMRGNKEVNDLISAVNRLGIKFTSNLALGLAMEQMFQATSDAIDRRMRSIWTGSTEIASICHVLATHFTRLEPDQALLGGLTHKIGALPVLTYAEEHKDLLNDAFALDKLIEKLHPILGCHILNAWKFPKELLKVPSLYLKFHREQENVDYADLVSIAVLQSISGTDHPFTQMDWNEVTCFQRVGLQPDQEISEVLDLDDDIDNLLI